MRWRLAALGANLAVVARAGVAYVVSHGDRNGRQVRAAATPTPLPTRSPALASLAPAAPSPTRLELSEERRRPRSPPALGGALAAVLLDPTTGEQLSVPSPGARLPPASTTKLL